MDACEVAINLGTIAFLNHLKTYDVAKDLAIVDGEGTYKTIKTFNTVFHPNRHHNKEEHIKMLYGEISSMLNNLKEKHSPPKTHANEKV